MNSFVMKNNVIKSPWRHFYSFSDLTQIVLRGQGSPTQPFHRCVVKCPLVKKILHKSGFFQKLSMQDGKTTCIEDRGNEISFNIQLYICLFHINISLFCQLSFERPFSCPVTGLYACPVGILCCDWPTQCVCLHHVHTLKIPLPRNTYSILKIELIRIRDQDVL